MSQCVYLPNAITVFIPGPKFGHPMMLGHRPKRYRLKKFAILSIVIDFLWLSIPAGTRRNNNAFITSKRRRWRRLDAMKTLSLRHYCVMCPLGWFHVVISVICDHRDEVESVGTWSITHINIAGLPSCYHSMYLLPAGSAGTPWPVPSCIYAANRPTQSGSPWASHCAAPVIRHGLTGNPTLHCPAMLVTHKALT